MADSASDTEIIGRMRDRQEAGLRQAICAHGPYIAEWLRRSLYVLDRSDRETALYEAFLKLWWDPSVFDPERGSLRALLCTIAVNKAKDILKKERRYSAIWQQMLAYSPPCPNEDTETTTCAAPGNGLLLTTLYATIDDLPDTQRRIIEYDLHQAGGETAPAKEVAQALGLATASVYSLRSRAWSFIRRRMGENGSGPDEETPA